MSMTYIPAVPLLTLLLAGATLAADLDAQRSDRGGFGRRGRDLAAVELEHLRFHEIEVESVALRRGSDDVVLYLPAGVAEDAELPLVIWLHGMSADHRRFHFEGAPVLDRLVGAGEVPPLAFAAVHVSSRTIYANGEAAGDVEDYLVRELPQALAGRYPVSAEPRRRAIMGISIGGMGALNLALRNPSSFRSVAAHSAAVFPPDPAALPPMARRSLERFGERLGWNEVVGDPIDPARYAEVNPHALIRRLGKPYRLRIHFDVGTNDRYGFGPENVLLHDDMLELGIPHSFALIDGGEHSWGGGTVQRALEASLRFVGEGFAGEGSGAAGRRRDGGR